MSFLYARNGPLNELAFYLTLLEVLSDQIELENIISCIFFPLTNVPTAARTMETSEMVKKNHLFGQFLHKFQQVWSLNQIGSMLIKSFLVLTHRLTWSDIYSAFTILHWPFIQQIEPISDGSRHMINLLTVNEKWPRNQMNCIGKTFSFRKKELEKNWFVFTVSIINRRYISAVDRW